METRPELNDRITAVITFQAIGLAFIFCTCPCCIHTRIGGRMKVVSGKDQASEPKPMDAGCGNSETEGYVRLNSFLLSIPSLSFSLMVCVGSIL